MASSGNKLMRLVQYDSLGGGAAGLKHVEVPVPTPKKDEILVKIEATCLNPGDCHIQTGMMRPILPPRLPFTPGTDIAGEIIGVGPQVKNFKIGDKIMAMLDSFRGGGLADYVVAKEKVAALRPLEVSAPEGAALAMAGLTAYQALTGPAGIKLDNNNNSGPQANILVTAASGGVGHIAVQLAKLANAHVTATCGARNIELVRSLGADEVIDYQTPEGAALKSPSGQKYDVVINCAKGISWGTFEPNLSRDGKVDDITPSASTYLMFFVKKLTFASKLWIPFVMIPKHENLRYLGDLVKDGKVKIVIDSKHRLSEVGDAWAKCIDGHATGKIVVEH